MHIKLLGRMPKSRSDASIPYSIEPEETLTHLFVQTMGNQYPTPQEQEAMKDIARETEGYMDALRIKTKTKILGNLNSYVIDRRNQGQAPSPKVLQSKIKTEFKSANSHLVKIAEAEGTKTRNVSNAMNIKRMGETSGNPDPTVIFSVLKDKFTCAECLRVHFLSDGVTPRPFKLSEVKHEYHKKGEDTCSLWGLHPNCRCTLTIVPKGFGFKQGRIAFVDLGYDFLKDMEGKT